MTLEDFITKWQPILTHWTGAVEDSQFAEDCWACVFEMDKGRSFVEAFPNKHSLMHAGHFGQGIVYTDAKGGLMSKFVGRLVAFPLLVPAYMVLLLRTLCPYVLVVGILIIILFLLGFITVG